jgi:hypothetical protein
LPAISNKSYKTPDFMVSNLEKTWVKESQVSEVHHVQKRTNNAIASIGQQKKTMEYTLLFDNFRTEPHNCTLDHSHFSKSSNGGELGKLVHLVGAESEFYRLTRKRVLVMVKLLRKRIMPT